MGFEFAYRWVGPADPLIRDFAVGADVTPGTLVALTNGRVGPAASASTTIAGLVLDPGETDDNVKVMVSNDVVFRVPYVGTEKTSLTEADIGTAFALATGARAIDLDTTDGGMCQVINYDNDKKIAYVIVKGRVFTY